MSLQLTTPPSAEPITLDQAKAHLRVDTTDDDALITSLIAAARARAEWNTGRAFVTQSWTLWLDGWPCNGIVEIPLPPLQSVASVTAYAMDGTPIVLDASTYQFDSAASPARLALKPNASPPVNLRALNAIAIAFTAGYGAASDVPAPLQQAILQIAAVLYAHRGDEAAELPQDALALLAPYRVVKL
ncbi:MAG: phage head-tail connector protein [Proteobacteria bacterium]|nr:phage head-tail connector protein [Pseudomonadota bacterium]